MNPNEPLGLPAGSVRAILAILLVASTVMSYFITGQISTELATLAGAVSAYYFAYRQASPTAEPPPDEPFIG